MHEDGCVERTPHMPIAECNGAVDVLSNRVCINGAFGEETTECFGSETYIVCILRVNPWYECPGKLIVGSGTVLFGVGMLGDEGALTLFGAGIVGVAQWYLRQ